MGCSFLNIVKLTFLNLCDSFCVTINCVGQLMNLVVNRSFRCTSMNMFLDGLLLGRSCNMVAELGMFCKEN
uniref:Uncharacterized protein n=1 Tax=Rhizophora mucronata TaxID=61149 RepID=A0A2P2PZG4_RHIMU